MFVSWSVKNVSPCDHQSSRKLVFFLSQRAHNEEIVFDLDTHK